MSEEVKKIMVDRERQHLYGIHKDMIQHVITPSILPEHEGHDQEMPPDRLLEKNGYYRVEITPVKAIVLKNGEVININE